MNIASIEIFPKDFLHKLINFPNTTLINLFNILNHSIELFLKHEASQLDPLVCENACHTRAFTLWHLYNKYEDHKKIQVWHDFLHSIDNIIKKISQLPPIDPHTKLSIHDYLEKHHLYVELPRETLFEIKFIFLSYLLTRTKKQFPSSSYMLNEKTCLEALSDTGLVHNKIKSLVGSAQKELSAMSCLYIQKHSKIIENENIKYLLVTRYDDHKRSYLPQFPTAKVIFFSALKEHIPIIIKASRFLKSEPYDQLLLLFYPSDNNKNFQYINTKKTSTRLAIICEGIIEYTEKIESVCTYIERLNEYSLLDILLANFAAHPQFSSNLRGTPCIYEEAINQNSTLKSHLMQEKNEFHYYSQLAQKIGCSLENPSLLFLNHVFCDFVLNYSLSQTSMQTLRIN